MSKKDDKYKTESLNMALTLARIEKFCDRFDHSMRKGLKKDLKRFLCFLIPYSISMTAILLNPTPIIAAIAFTVTVVSLVISLNSKMKDDLGIKPKRSKKVMDIPEESADEILAKGIERQPVESYYTEGYKNFLTNYNPEREQETEEKGAYQIALEKQQKKRALRFPIQEEKDYLDKDETLLKIVHDIEVYKNAYNIPPINISYSDWNTFFDYLYEIFLNKGIENEFCGVATFTMQMALARALLESSKEITILDFLRNLYALEREYERPDGTKTRIPKRECLQIQRDIATHLEKKKVIEFKPKK